MRYCHRSAPNFLLSRNCHLNNTLATGIRISTSSVPARKDHGELKLSREKLKHLQYSAECTGLKMQFLAPCVSQTILRLFMKEMFQVFLPHSHRFEIRHHAYTQREEKILSAHSTCRSRVLRNRPFIKCCCGRQHYRCCPAFERSASYISLRSAALLGFRFCGDRTFVLVQARLLLRHY